MRPPRGRTEMRPGVRGRQRQELGLCGSVNTQAPSAPAQADHPCPTSLVKTSRPRSPLGPPAPRGGPRSWRRTAPRVPGSLSAPGPRPPPRGFHAASAARDEHQPLPRGLRRQRPPPAASRPLSPAPLETPTVRVRVYGPRAVTAVGRQTRELLLRRGRRSGRGRHGKQEHWERRPVPSRMGARLTGHLPAPG